MPNRRLAQTDIARQMVMAAAIVLTAMVGVGANAAAMRLVLPLLSLVVAALLLYRNRFETYVSFVVWIFLLTPFIRRIIDFKAGWESVNFVMLAPYAAASLSMLVVPFLLFRGARTVVTTGCLAIVCVSLYGLIIAAIEGRLQAGLLEFLRWAVPPCVAVLIAINPDRHEATTRRLQALVIVAVPLLGAYAVYQYLYIPGWDGTWMLNSAMESIGKPLPYQVRVFSTLNSPGSFAAFLLFGLTVLVASRGGWRWPGIALGAAAFLLTLVRSSWLGFAVALCWIVMRGDTRSKVTLGLLVVGAIVIMPIALTLPDVGVLVEQRLQTLGQVGSDNSFEDRWAGYAALGTQLEASSLGKGLGVAGAYQGADGGNTLVVDGGPVEIFMSLGVVAGTIYLIVVSAVALSVLLTRLPATPLKGILVGAQAISLANILLLSSGTITTGENGMFFWISVGLVAGSQALAPVSVDASLKLTESPSRDQRQTRL